MTEGDDCDDASALVYPGARELCDGLDDDCDDTDPDTWPGAPTECDATVDRDCDGWMDGQDLDGDGHLGCEDCDDHDATVFPGAAEVCDGADNDCDGVTGGSAAVDTTVLYPDADGDTYGDGSVRIYDCPGLVGFVERAGDCDDANADISPRASETCDTDVGDDCNGVTNQAGADRCRDWYIDGDGDGYGAGTSICMCAATGDYTTSRSSDCDDDASDVSPGAVEQCLDGVDQALRRHGLVRSGDARRAG